MSYPDNLIRAGFHDTSLVGASQIGSTITLNVEFYTDDDVEASTKVVISGVERVECEGVPLPQFKMKTDHGSIVTLEREGKDVVLLVDWVDFSAKTRTTCFYRLIGINTGLVTEAIATGPN